MTQNDMIAAIASLFPTAQYTVDFTIKVANNVATLLTWNNALGTQPTDAVMASALAAIQLNSYKGIQSATIESSYQNAALNTPIAYMGTTFWTDADSQFKLLAAAWGFDKLGAVPAGFAWWDSTGAAVPMTLAQLDGLALATLNAGNATFIKRKTYLATIAAATTVAAVQAVVWA
jgi:hypothetical protein